IFPTKKYDDGYLKTLEHLHICAGASDRLRYAILNKFGGVYLDTDLITKFSLKDMENNQIINNLIDSVEWDAYYNANLKNQKLELIINQMITLDCLNQLNEEKIKDFAENWKKTFEGNAEKNQQIFQEIAKELKTMNLDMKPEMQLSDFPISNFSQTSFFIYKVDNEEMIANALIFSKKKSEFLQEVMKKIETIDEKLKNMDTYTKLINKNEMIMYHTGPTNINYSIEEMDDDFYFSSRNQPKIANLHTLNSIASSWFGNNYHQNRMRDEIQLKFYFWSDKNETKKYFKNFYLKPEEIQNLSIEENYEEERD
ncbi:MAG: glycosyltransferase, partial [Spiroplasma sp.]